MGRKEGNKEERKKGVRGEGKEGGREGRKKKSKLSMT